ncbi:hypothetical protein ACFV0O_26195 [Kitasatospora sp. NPDC059577]|uniref:hypothetical protein n=1 Tax=Kitasatospora sp. NPDC059577 TaxID=3346873 RepID=UPI0036B898D2
MTSSTQPTAAPATEAPSAAASATGAPSAGAPSAEARNTPARVSFWSAAMGVSLVVAVFVTPIFWLMYGGFYTFGVFVCGLVAIPAGHLGRRRGKRLGGRDRGLALLGILTGWLLLLCGLLLVLAYAGVVAGLAVLVGSAS